MRTEFGDGVVNVCPDPVFIIGSPRSGTTALARALAQHSRLWTSHESYVLHNLYGAGQADHAWRRNHERTQAPSWLRTEEVTRDEFLAALGIGVNALFSSRSGGRRWIDQTPLYTLMVDDLGVMFPGATFVHIVRDGRRVVRSMSNFLSKFERRPGAVRYVPQWATDFTDACRTWRTWVDTAASFCVRNPDRSVTVIQDVLEKDPDGELERVFAALGIDAEPGPSDYLRDNRVNSSFANAARGEGAADEMQWGMAERECFLVEAGATMVAQGLVTSEELLAWAVGAGVR